MVEHTEEMAVLAVAEVKPDTVMTEEMVSQDKEMTVGMAAITAMVAEAAKALVAEATNRTGEPLIQHFQQLTLAVAVAVDMTQAVARALMAEAVQEMAAYLIKAAFLLLVIQVAEVEELDGVEA